MPAVRRHGHGVYRLRVRYRRPVVDIADVATVVASSAVGAGRVILAAAAAGSGRDTVDVLCSATVFGPIAV
jgi:hypothetical protein